MIVGKLHRRRDTPHDDQPESGRYTRHRWLLIGAAGAVQFIANEIPAGTQMRQVYSSFTRHRPHPNGALWDGRDLGYHSPRPMHEGMAMMQTCDVIEGQCWYDGSGLQAIELCDEWAAAGYDDEVIWRTLEEHYLYTFHGD